MNPPNPERALRRSIESHYGGAGMAERILDRLRELGIDPQNTDLATIPALDELHVRGRAGSLELAGLGTLVGPLAVLDVGAGLGGSSRLLASRFGCRVVGVDLTTEFCRDAERLSAGYGLADLTSFVQGSGTELPIRDGSFPVVWTQHTQMNVAAKVAFYDELVRVLSPGGQLLFHDIFAASEETPRFPLPWASEPSLSHLARAEQVADHLRTHGLQCVEWRDRTLPTIAWLRELLHEGDPEAARQSGPSLMMGDTQATKMGNLLHGFESGRLRVVQARWDRPPLAPDHRSLS